MALGEAKGNQVRWRYFSTESSENEQHPGIMTTEELLSVYQLNNSTEFPNNPEIALVISGNETWNILNEQGFMHNLIYHIRVFSRMSPDSKVAIV
eukprot:Pgem_evm1s7694